MLSSGQQKFKEMREKTILKDNWNLFVSDPEFKTDFLLRFKTSSTQQLYEKHLISSSKYSLRVMMMVVSAINQYSSQW